MERGNSLKKRTFTSIIFEEYVIATRLMALFSYLVFVAGHFILYNNIDWGGQYLLLIQELQVSSIQTTNKFINSKYNSPSGSYGIENEGILQRNY